MSILSLSDRWLALKVGVVAALMAAFALLGARHEAGRFGVVYTHLAYAPLVLAAFWWGRRGAVVAATLGFSALLAHLGTRGRADLWNDGARLFFFLLVSFGVGALSDRARATHRALRASREMYRWLTEESFAGIMMYRDDRILFVNNRLAEMVGRRPDEMVGQAPWSLFAADGMDPARERLARAGVEGSPNLRYECRMVRGDGRRMWADVASSATFYQGQPAVVAHVLDITDRKRAEEQQRELAALARRQEEQLIHSTRLAELGEMAAAVAHELNQPLTGIRNYAKNAIYMMDNDVGDAAEVRDNLRLISEQVDRASRIISQMRELTRRSERQMAAIDLNRAVQDSVDFLMPQMKLSNVEVGLDLAPDLPPVIGDRIRLEQVLLNLLTNARQAMEGSAERRLSVRTFADGDAECPVAVEVRDTGKGFTREERAKLFTPFFTTKKAGHGTGLGLPISKSIIKDHKGRIEADGEAGRGAVFTVRLPAAPPSAPRSDQA